jgi:Kef-type K+ transport system membrane component KefB
MSAHDALPLLFKLAVLFLLATGFGLAFLRARIPELLGAIAAGLILGPTGIDLFNWNFAHLSQKAVANGVASLGLLNWVSLIMLMFSAGLHLDVSDGIKPTRLVLTLIGTSFVAVMIGLVATPVIMALVTDDRIATDSQSIAAYRIILAIAVAVTSVPFLSKIFLNTELIGTEFARNVLVAAGALDVLLWCLVSVAEAVKSATTLDVLPLAVPIVTALGYTAVVVLLGPQLCTLYADRHNEETAPVTRDLAAILCFLFFIVGIGSLLGINPLISSILAGFCVARAGLADRSAAAAVNLVTGRLFVPLYFAIVGLSLDLSKDTNVQLIVVFLVWSSIIKFTSILLGARFIAKEAPISAMNYAVAMNTRGGPGIVLASVALNAGLIGEPTFIAMVIASIATAGVTELWLIAFRDSIVPPAHRTAAAAATTLVPSDRMPPSTVRTR